MLCGKAWSSNGALRVDASGIVDQRKLTCVAVPAAPAAPIKTLMVRHMFWDWPVHIVKQFAEEFQIELLAGAQLIDTLVSVSKSVIGRGRIGGCDEVEHDTMVDAFLDLDGGLECLAQSDLRDVQKEKTHMHKKVSEANELLQTYTEKNEKLAG